MAEEPEEPRPEAAAPEEATGREAEVLAARRASLERLGTDRAFALNLRSVLGVDRPASIADLRAAHADLGPDAMTEARAVLAGRVVLKRDLGKLVFATIRDRDAELQVVFDRGRLEPDAFALLREVDLGDIIGVEGTVGTTRRGELSLFAERWAMLTKALRPLPEKWHGLQDPDLQQRRRYLHLITDEAPRRAVLARAAVLRTIRSVLEERGFVEFEGPILQTVAGGANARPFATHPPRARHPDEAPDLARALPEADARGRLRPRVRAGPQLPERGHRPRPQSGVHDARGLRGLRRLRHDDGAVGDARDRDAAGRWIP